MASEEKNQNDILDKYINDLNEIDYVFADKPIDRFKSKLKINDKTSKLDTLKKKLKKLRDVN